MTAREHVEYILCKPGRIISTGWQTREQAEAFGGGRYIAEGWTVEEVREPYDADENERADLKERVAELQAALTEACDELEDAHEYIDDYFLKKHRYRETLERLRKVLRGEK